MTYSDTMTTRSYSGSIGCMCGCKGSYNESERSRKTKFNTLINHPDVEFQVFNPSEGILVVDTETRTNAVYLTQQGIDAVRNFGLKETD